MVSVFWYTPSPKHTKYKKEWDTHLVIVSPIFFFLGVFLELFLLLEIESLFDRFTVGFSIIHQEVIIVFHHGHHSELGPEVRDPTVFGSDSLDVLKFESDPIVTNHFLSPYLNAYLMKLFVRDSPGYILENLSRYLGMS